MPINIPCEYECDQCHKKVDGLSGKLPDGWMLGFDTKACWELGFNVTSFKTTDGKKAVDAGNVQGVFHSKACHDAFVEALVEAAVPVAPEEQAVSVEALTVPLG